MDFNYTRLSESGVSLSMPGIIGYIWWILHEYLESLNIDLDLTLWTMYVLHPLLITFLLPLGIVFGMYMNAFWIQIYYIHQTYIKHSWFDGISFYDAAVKVIAIVWDANARLYHGYEVKGWENLPSGPCLLVYYHGAFPLDNYYFISRYNIVKNTFLYNLSDSFIFKVPGWKRMLTAARVVPGSMQAAKQILTSGEQLLVSPGGVYEAQFGDSDYRLMWKNRVGFAKLALEAKVPIVPIFTENIREAFRSLGLFKSVFHTIYTWTRLPFVPVYGGFPVKLITHIGKPLLYDDFKNNSPEELRGKVHTELTNLIQTNQRIPGSIFHALLQRVTG